MTRPGILLPALAMALGLSGCQMPSGGTVLACRAPVPLADRGIGGTGAVADRGIGGTGGPVFADRGIGGTGIVGAITGFGSICVDGKEVALAPDSAVTIDGAAARPADLRVGQVVALTATDRGAMLGTDHVAAFHQVSGPVSAVGPDMLVVAGQMVRLDGRAALPRQLRPGDFVAVSGLRDLTGTIRPTLILPRPPGEVIVTGRPERVQGGWHLGALELRFRHVPPPRHGRAVMLRGHLSGEVLTVTTLAPAPDSVPRGGAARLLREGYADVRDGRLRLGDGLEAPLAPDFGQPPPSDRAAVVEFVETPSLGLVAAHWSAAPQSHGGGNAGAAVGNGPGNGEGGGGGGEGGGSAGGGGDGGGGGGEGGGGHGATGHGSVGGGGGGGGK